eukprot:CAMPEP_0201652218 /NCGR_PEP_ID=MMETSP0493-20130528/44365_1 /ASSEMBLY_ACC=CAM_ASM_000838 /TAXON_ID=420259 /ORGANISM="Thalassiosira gravida, Strain GMp14c1" /LENGTH=574 /DNA_ID=CAMNT_0048128731 /DNA_START=35 /DNA_END=1759 /DNA_ORIENTATION=+
MTPTITGMPSSMPSESPSVSVQPSPSSVNPSISGQPSLQPSENPTSSSLPSAVLSMIPSVSLAPSLYPSHFPSISASPSMVKRKLYCGSHDSCGSNNVTVPASDPHAVRCCISDGSRGSDRCTEKSSPLILGESRVPRCNFDATFYEAVVICDDFGGRLCSGIELDNNCARGTGCSLNQFLVWGCTATNDQCDTNAECCGGNCYDGTCISSVPPTKSPAIPLNTSIQPSWAPSLSIGPTLHGSFGPSFSDQPSILPTSQASDSPSAPLPSRQPSTIPTNSIIPSFILSQLPSVSSKPSANVSALPSSGPSESPSSDEVDVSAKPSLKASTKPSISAIPTTQPNTLPSSGPSGSPNIGEVDVSAKPSLNASTKPSISAIPTTQPNTLPSSGPSGNPSRDEVDVSAKPSLKASAKPSISAIPTTQPITIPPSIRPSVSLAPSSVLRMSYCGAADKCGPGNNSQVVSANTELGVRCCSTNAALGLDKCDTKSVPRVYGQSVFSRRCRLASTFDEATITCEDFGGRLCSGEEILNNCVKGTGCRLNSFPVWGCTASGDQCVTNAECCGGKCNGGQCLA